MAKISSLDIDLDLNGSKKDYVFERIKNKFGEDRFLQVCTFSTEGSKSAIQTACRGLGYDTEDAQYISSLIPWERGENYSIHDCIYGNEEKGRKPVKQFIDELAKFPRLRETALGIEGLIRGRSVHAGGVVLFNKDFNLSNNAMMLSPKGVKTTQFNLDDSQAGGSIKYDLLTVNALEKLQMTIDFLLEDGVIEWQGSLRKTFNKYFHPEVIDKESPELFRLASSGTVPDLFQFSTQVGHNAIVKAQPANLIEMTATNSLMRLASDGGEQPIDTFIRFKENPQLWYDEMEKFGLNKEEVKMMEEHLAPLNGVADTQESVMLLAMDERIAKFTIADATDLRKTIAGKSDEMIRRIKEKLYGAAERVGTRIEVVNYVWHQISRMLSYAFSSPHTLAYSLIAMIQLNIVRDYNPIYWQTAVLTVNSGSQEVEEDEKSNTKNYGKTASAIGQLKTLGVNVELPLVNSARFSFTPDVENDRIVFSLKGISGIGDEVAREIIANRPYSSFDDFHEKLYATGVVKKAQMLQLVKAGCFNEFCSQPEAMKQFLVKEVEVKESLNGQNMPRIINLGLLEDEDLVHYREKFHFRAHLKKNVHEVLTSPKNRILYIDDEDALDFFLENFSNVTPEGYKGSKVLIDEKVFDKEYKAIFEPLMEMIKEKEFIRKFNVAQFYELWNEHAQGTVASWQMDAVSFYHGEHELDRVDVKRYGITDFFALGEEPVVTDTYMWRGRERENYKVFTIIGTVLDKDKNKHTATVLTPTGVVTVKTYAGAFSHYDRQVKGVVNGKNAILERSWFTRGNLLLLNGYRQGDMFRLRAERSSGQRTINKITEIRQDGSIGLQSERIKGK